MNRDRDGEENGTFVLPWIAPPPLRQATHDWWTKATLGALRSQIDAHGPVSEEWVGSAAKRIVRALSSNPPRKLLKDRPPTHESENEHV